MRYLRPVKRLPLLLFTLLCLASTCEEPLPIPDADQLTKARREQLGDLLLGEIQRRKTVEILPDSGNVGRAYRYLRGLYQQVSNTERIDLNSGADNRWNRHREWQIFIENNSTARLFTLPGGHLFVSTGLLWRLEREYEVYALFALETQVIAEELLLGALITRYGTQTLLNLTDETLAANELTARILAEELPSVALSAADVEYLDPRALTQICRSSLYDPGGLRPLVADHPDVAYFEQRPNYPGRAARLLAFRPETGDCGDLRTNGKFASEVLAVLPQ